MTTAYHELAVVLHYDEGRRGEEACKRDKRVFWFEVVSDDRAFRRKDAQSASAVL